MALEGAKNGQKQPSPRASNFASNTTQRNGPKNGFRNGPYHAVKSPRASQDYTQLDHTRSLTRHHHHGATDASPVYTSPYTRHAYSSGSLANTSNMGPMPLHHSYHSYQQPPQTPFDLTYGASLLPSHLLLSSPFLATPHSNSTPRFNGRNHLATGLYNPYQTSYGQSLPLRMPPDPNDIRRQRNGRYHGLDDRTRQIPYEVNYEVLPPTITDDEFRTPSLLFSDLCPELHLNDFLSKFDKCERLESVYLVDALQQSFIVSFLTQETCLDFYNGVLQKLSEFKKELKSPKLTLNFVRLHDADSGPTRRDVRTEVLRMGATCSVALEFGSEISREALFEQLPFLDNSGPRYVVKCIEIVNTNRISKHWGSHYAVVHFISIAMAIEIIAYLKMHKNTIPDLQRFQYVITSSTSGKSELRTLSGSQVNLREPAKNSRTTGIIVDDNTSMNSYSANSNVPTKKLTIQPKMYGLPIVTEPNQHLSHITASKPLSMDSVANSSSNNLASPAPQEMLVNDHGHSSSCGSMLSVVPPETPGQSHTFTNYPYYTDMSKPLGQTLQQQFTSAAQVATAMGGGAGNRTVYIGNINQRSKAEDICNVVRGGLLQNVKFIAAKQICFVTFIDAAAAVQFFANSSIEPIVLHGNILKVGWGHHSGDLPQSISLAVTAGASRNVYVSLPEHAFKDKFINDPEYHNLKEKYKLPSKETLLQDFRAFGDIEQINFLPDNHCCWINFMNISNAIKLVEDANNIRNAESFHERFQNRYRGLIMGYGKDRCGNINKNLVANKNSKHYKKVKKTSYKIRLRQQQEKSFDVAKNAPVESSNDQKIVQADAFGISLVDDQEPARDSDEEQKLEEKELLRLSHDVHTAEEGLGISLAPTNAVEQNPIDDGASSDSSDIDIIVSRPNSRNHTQLGDGEDQNTGKADSHQSSDISRARDDPHAFRRFSPMVSSTSLDAVPPLAPSTMTRQFKVATQREKKNELYRNHMDGIDQRPHSQGSSRRSRSMAIPGSDVMAQYLAQLQHSTFMYAANILGVEDGEPQVFYDENGHVEPMT
ncbi:LAME_0G13300g1_1 [Lachancea meyersii CBS 8951]|uniref:LAME_0G13300g1_1 n=1 Tax=Lachancea meyersii CBS 8951 TaxID=1266667 RepID=A0A1G4KA59_9SACH|nr:LAME_0G13300g1_1 [Lachancea meyersii CBS 8951]